MRNDGFPSRARLNMLRAQYPKGTRIELVHTSDPYTKLQPGTKGTVEFVDDAEAGIVQIHNSFLFLKSQKTYPFLHKNG